MNKQLLVPKERILEYIPQRDPIVMVDSIVECEGNKGITNLEVRAGNMFVSGGKMQEPGLVENIAQSAAAKAGYEIKRAGIKEVYIGFIAGIKDLYIHDLPSVGEIIETHIEVKNEVMGITIVEAKSFCGDRPIADCEIRIFIQKNENA